MVFCRQKWRPQGDEARDVGVTHVPACDLPESIWWVSHVNERADGKPRKTVLNWKFTPPRNPPDDDGDDIALQGYQGLLTGPKGCAVEADMRVARGDGGEWEVQVLIMSEYAALSRVVRNVHLSNSETSPFIRSVTPSKTDVACEVACPIDSVSKCPQHQQHTLRVVVDFQSPSKKVARLAALWREERGLRVCPRRPGENLRQSLDNFVRQSVPWVGGGVAAPTPWQPAPPLRRGGRGRGGRLPRHCRPDARVGVGSPESALYSLPDLFSEANDREASLRRSEGRPVASSSSQPPPPLEPPTLSSPLCGLRPVPSARRPAADDVVVVLDGGVRAASYPSCEPVRGFRPGDHVKVRNGVRDAWALGAVRAVEGGVPIVAVDGPVKQAKPAPFALCEPDRSHVPSGVTKPGHEVRIGTRARVRDTSESAWKYGTVTEVSASCPSVLVEGQGHGCRWAFVEVEDKVKPPTVLFDIGDSVRVRDNELEPWMFGRVTGKDGREPVVTPDGGLCGDTWRYCEHFVLPQGCTGGDVDAVSHAAAMDELQGVWIPVAQNPSAPRCGPARPTVSLLHAAPDEQPWNAPVGDAAEGASTTGGAAFSAGSRVRVRLAGDDEWLYGTVFMLLHRSASPPEAQSPRGRGPLEGLQLLLGEDALRPQPLSGLALVVQAGAGLGLCSPATPGTPARPYAIEADAERLCLGPAAASSCCAPAELVDLDSIRIDMPTGADEPHGFEDEPDYGDGDSSTQKSRSLSNASACSSPWAHLDFSLPTRDLAAPPPSRPPPLEAQSFADLPERIIVWTCGYLDKETLFEVTRVNHYVRAMACRDMVWKPIYWEDARKAQRLMCLPKCIRNADAEAVVDRYVVMPTELRETWMEGHRQKREEAARRRKREARVQKRRRAIRRLEKTAPEFVAPMVVLVLLCLLTLAVHALLAETDTMAFPYGHHTRAAVLANIATAAAHAILVYALCYIYFIPNYENPAFLFLVTEWSGIALTGLLMLHKAVRRDVGFSWGSTSQPLVYGLVITLVLFFIVVFTRLQNGHYSYIRQRLPSFTAVLLVPLPIIVTLFQASVKLDEEGPVQCVAIFWPLLLFIGVMLPWPPCVLLILLILRCYGRNDRGFCRWIRREVCPSVCTYLLYCFVCAFFAGMMDGMCFAPQLGLTLLVIFLTILTIIAFAVWQRAIFEG
eukprot:TRINITY_DN15210_c0_g1_i2.p1 TRINITY_DN15210_c0_g1~~TRINITY_DN15210_c0_g1_i2.p1  ORF type:complete len:1180 (+),score=305.93 TRINITY_DN15210_c0_g1_i2:147-3686(+)